MDGVDNLADAIRQVLHSEGWLSPSEAQSLQAELVMLRERLHDLQQDLAFANMRQSVTVQ